MMPGEKDLPASDLQDIVEELLEGDRSGLIIEVYIR